jgi:hypothetical protein
VCAGCLEGGEALTYCRVLFLEPVECGLAKVHPVLSRIRTQREHLHIRQDVFSCTSLAAQLEERLLELFDLLPVLLRCVLLLFQRKR